MDNSGFSRTFVFPHEGAIGSGISPASDTEHEAAAIVSRYTSPQTASLWAVPGRNVRRRIPDAGAVADAYADLGAFLAAYPGQNLFFPALETYALDFSSAARTLTVPDGTKLFGYGSSLRFDVDDPTEGATHTFMRLAGSDHALHGLHIDAGAIALPPTVSAVVLFGFGGSGGRGLTLVDTVIDGGIVPGDGTLSHTVFGLFPDSDEDFGDIVLVNARWRRMTRAWLRTNTATNTQRRLHVIGGRFEEFTRGNFTLNSPSGELSDVLFLGASFKDNFGRTTGGGFGAADAFSIGLQSRDARVLGCYFGGIGSGIHTEESALRQIVTANAFALTDAYSIGFRSVPNNIGTGGPYDRPEGMLLANNIFYGPGQDQINSRCVEFANTANGAPATFGLVTGNIARHWFRGLQLHQDAIESASGNVVSDCAEAIMSVRPILQVHDNRIMNSDKGLVASIAGMWGHHSFQDVDVWGYNTQAEQPSNGQTSISGWDTEVSGVTIGMDTTPGNTGTDTTIDIGPLGRGIYGELRTHLYQTGFMERIFVHKVSRNHLTPMTLTSVETFDLYAIGDVTVVGFEADVVNDRLKLRMRSFNDETDYENCRVQIHFNGLHVLTDNNILLFEKVAANFNSTADQVIPAVDTFSTYKIDRITAINQSIPMTTAAGGVYTGAGKTGVVLVAASQTYEDLVTSEDAVVMVPLSNRHRTEPTLYLSLTVPQGAAATCDIRVWGQIIEA